MSESLENTFLKNMRQLLAVYGIHKSLVAIETDVHITADSEVTPKIVKQWGKKIGVHLSLERVSWRKMLKRSDPCILILKSGDTYAYLPQQGQNAGNVVDDYAGYAIFYKGETKPNPSLKKEKHVDWFWKPIVSYWKSYAEIIVCSILINLFAIALPLFTMNVYDKVVPNFAEETLITLTIGIVVVLSFDFGMKTVRSYILERISTDVSTEYDHALMERLFSFPALALNMTVGEKASIFRELQTIRDFYASKLATTFVDLPFFVMFIFVIYLLSPALAVIPVIGALIILVLNFFLHIPVNRMTKKHLEDMQTKSSALVEVLSSIETIKSFNATPSQLHRWKLVASNTSKSAQRGQFMSETVSHFSLFVLHIVNIAVVFFGVYEIQNEGLSVGMLIACTILSGRAIAPVLSLSGIVGKLKHARDVLAAIDKLFQLPQDVQSARNYEDIGIVFGKIVFDKVSYQYPGQATAALRDVSLTIAPGEKIGLIGQTGAGKSTLAALASGYLKPLQGNVLVDDRSIETLHPVILRGGIGIVPQDPEFISGSIRENILLGRDGVSDADFDKAVMLSGLDIFIAQTGQGFETNVGEHGRNLSGGQKQSIALARALIHDPKVIIFDEPTNGMDHALEKRVMGQLSEYLSDKTFIMITHRTSLLPLVDRLVLLNKGVITADGTREEIMKKLAEGS